METRPLVQAHHNTVGYLCGYIIINDIEQTILEPRPNRYILIGSQGVQPATPASAENVVRLDLLDVVLRARFLGINDNQLKELLTGIIGENTE